MTFRRAREDEADAIFSLFRAVTAHGRKTGTSHWSDDYPTRDILEDDFRHGQVYVLEDGGRVVASVSMVADELPPEGEDIGWTGGRASFLARLCVAPELQGRGIGELVMRRVSDEARKQGYGSTRHFASAGNKAALRLYERMGYRNLGLFHVWEGDYYAFEMLL